MLMEIALGENMKEILNTIYEYLALYGMNVLGAIAIFIFGWFAAKLVTKGTQKAMRRAKVDEAIVTFVGNVVSILALAFVVIAAINKLGVQTTSVVAAFGAVGLGVCLALQGSLANIAAALLIIIYKPFKSGDFIDAAGTMGTVKKMNMFCVTLRSPDNVMISLPNAKLIGDRVINYSNLEKRRLDLDFGISYDDNIQKAREILQKAVVEDKRVLKSPEPVIVVSELGDSAVTVKCRVWIKPSDYWPFNFEMLEKAKLALEAGGCSIPFPQRDVHMYEEKKV